MQKSVYLFLFFFFITLKSFTQQNFTKSKIINSQGDTLTGFIDYKEWIKSPKQISFKKNLSEVSVTYSTEELKGFIIDFNGEIYRNLTLNYEKLSRSSSKPKFESLSKYANRSKIMVEKNILVRQLSNGKVNLYQFIDDNLENHLLIESNDIIEPLIYHIIEVKNEIVSLKQYQIQLNTLLINSCKKLNFEKVEYLPNDIKKLIDTYNQCFEKAIITSTIKEVKGKWEYGITAGIGYASFKHIFPTTYSFVTLIGNKNTAPVGGIFFNYSFGRGRGKYAILNELNTYTIESNTFETNRNYHYLIQYVAIQTLFRYKFYVKNPSIYLILGFSNGFSNKNNSAVTYIDGSNEKFQQNYFRKDEQSYILGVGIAIKKLMVESRYIIGNGFSSSPNTNTQNRRIELILKLNFGKI
jgi:hypothetical protein